MPLHEGDLVIADKGSDKESWWVLTSADDQALNSILVYAVDSAPDWYAQGTWWNDDIVKSQSALVVPADQWTDAMCVAVAKWRLLNV